MAATLPRFAVAFAIAVAFTGCKTDKAVQQGAPVDNGAPAAKVGAVDNAGAIQGTVHFDGTPPRRIPIDTSMDPGCMLSGSQTTEQVVVDNGKLANVFLYIKAGAPPSKAPAGTPPVVLDQKGCRYIPHVIALQQGGSVEFRNSDPTMHNVHIIGTGDQAMDVSQGPMGAPQTRVFNAPATMLPVRCNNHPWMNAFINVADTPYFAVSDSAGSFKIINLPPGTYTLAAVQEKLGEKDIQITVPAKGTAKAEFHFEAK
jgi:plastocyanin